MEKNFGKIAIREFNIFSLESLVPTIFYNCGPGYTDGKRDPQSTAKDASDARVFSFENPDGTKSISLLDNSCKFHDFRSADAIGKPNEAELLAKADVQFVSELISNYSQFQPVEKVYSTIAIMGFAAKIELYDIPRLVYSNVANKISEWAKQLTADAENPTLATLTQTDGTIYSCLRDSEGNIVLGCTKGDETQSVTLDEMMKITGASQQFADLYGEVYEETSININNDSGISEIIHKLNGEIDAEGVIVGKISQAKLDQFIELSNSAIQESQEIDLTTQNSSSPADLMTSEKNFTASSVLGSMNVHIDDQTVREVNDWFSEADPIRLQAYHWDQVDNNLQNLWFYGNDSTLAGYDLQSVMESNHIDWNIDLGGWDFPQELPSIESPEFAENYVNSFEYSLSDIDLGLSNDYLGNFDYASENEWYDNPNSLQIWSNNYIDPLVVKIGKGAVHTTNLEGSTVMFDMQANGQKVRTGWITPDHAFLVRDRNRNGKIDDSSEMFSERTSPKAATGFAALAQLDSNRDGWVSYKDKAFKDLRLWTDINVDGITQKGELYSLDEFGIRFIVVGQPTAKNVYDNGNLILNTNCYHSESRRGIYTGEIAEVLFNFGDTTPATSVYISDQATAVRTADGKTLQVLSDNKAQTINASMSGINLLVGGKGDILNAGNAQQSLLIGNGGATLNGNGGSTHFVVNNTGNIVNTGNGESFIEVKGDANTINAAKGTVQIDVDGSRNKITLGSDDFVDLGGSGNTLTAAGNTKGNEVVISGQKQTLNLSNADIALQENSSATLNGKNNDLSMEGHSTLTGKATGGTLMVWGDDNIATISNAFVGLSEGAELQLTGRNDQIVMAGDGELILSGKAEGTTVNVFGDDNKVTMTSGAINMAEGSEVDLSGKGNTVTMLGDADLLARDKGQRLEVFGDGNHASISGSTIIEHGLADIDIDGKANKLRTTPVRADLIQKEINSYQTSSALMDSLWDRYDQLIDCSFDQEWRNLQSNRMQYTLHPEVFAGVPFGDAKAADITSLTSSGTTLGSMLTSTAASSLQTRPLIPAPASASSAPVFS